MDIKSLHHVAYRCKDAKQTTDFYTKVLGLDGNIGSLPFTGLDLLIVIGIVLLLTGTGFALRRLATPPGP